MSAIAPENAAAEYLVEYEPVGDAECRAVTNAAIRFGDRHECGPATDELCKREVSMEGLTVQIRQRDGRDLLYVINAAGRTLGYMDSVNGLLFLGAPGNLELSWVAVFALWQWRRLRFAALGLLRPWCERRPGGFDSVSCFEAIVAALRRGEVPISGPSDDVVE